VIPVIKEQLGFALLGIMLNELIEFKSVVLQKKDLNDWMSADRDWPLYFKAFLSA